MTGYIRPTGNAPRNVLVSDARGDSVQAGQARVRLKLGALAYVNAQIGVEASFDIAAAALEVLCEAAIKYYEAVNNRQFNGRVDLSKATKLRIAALAYVNARHGVDATLEIARAGMGVLCEAAILYCEELSGISRPTR